MRVSTTWQHQLGVNAMLDQQYKLNQTQLKLSAGQKYLTPSENPVASANLLDLQQNIKVNEQYQVNIGAARQRLDLQESALGNATDVLQSIRELMVQGLNDSNSPQNRQQIAVQVEQLNKQLLAIANTQNANGEYIFAGFKSSAPAFTFDETAAFYTYQGDDNKRQIEIGPNRSVTDGNTGEEVFGSITGSTVPGDIPNIFEAVTQLASDLRNDQPDANSLTDIDNVLKKFETTRAETGARLKAMDSQESLNADYILDNKSTASAIGDLDYADALSKFNLQQVALQAAQQAFTRVQNLSLFNYL